MQTAHWALDWGVSNGRAVACQHIHVKQFLPQPQLLEPLREQLGRRNFVLWEAPGKLRPIWACNPRGCRPLWARQRVGSGHWWPPRGTGPTLPARGSARALATSVRCWRRRWAPREHPLHAARTLCPTPVSASDRPRGRGYCRATRRLRRSATWPPPSWAPGPTRGRPRQTRPSRAHRPNTVHELQCEQRFKSDRAIETHVPTGSRWRRLVEKLAWKRVHRPLERTGALECEEVDELEREAHALHPHSTVRLVEPHEFGHVEFGRQISAGAAHDASTAGESLRLSRLAAPHDHVARRLTRLGDWKRLASLVEQHQRAGRVEADVKCLKCSLYNVYYTAVTQQMDIVALSCLLAMANVAVSYCRDGLCRSGLWARCILTHSHLHHGFLTLLWISYIVKS